MSKVFTKIGLRKRIGWHTFRHRDDPECQWREPQGHSGTTPSRYSESHHGHLRSGCVG